jgi:hypothetical protein
MKRGWHSKARAGDESDYGGAFVNLLYLTHDSSCVYDTIAFCDSVVTSFTNDHLMPPCTYLAMSDSSDLIAVPWTRR